MEQTKLSLVINADDLGLLPGVNDSILDAAQFGLLTSASLMVNMPYAEDAAKKYFRRKMDQPDFQLGIGLHFCLTSGRPVCPPETVPLLVDSNGMFCHGFLSLLKRVASFSETKKKRAFMRQVSYELDAQFRLAELLALRYGFRLTHVDSHQHFHVLPRLIWLVRNEARKRNLVMRQPLEYFGSAGRFFRSVMKRFPGGIAKRDILAHYIQSARRQEIRFDQHESMPERTLGSLNACPIGYFGIIDTGHIDLNSFRRILDVIRPISEKRDLKTFEINLHPWSIDAKELELARCSQADLEFASSSWRAKEHETVMSRDVIQPLLDAKGIELVRFAPCSKIFY